MATTLEAARSILLNAVLHVDNSTLGTTNQDDAIKAACNEFIVVTDCNKKVTSISLAADAKEFNPVSTITTFEEDQFIDAEISFNPVKLVAYEMIRDRYADGAAPTPGRPQWMAMRTKTKVYVYPPPKVATTLELRHRETLTSFTSGTVSPASVSLNVPDEWIHQILHTGAKWRLLAGLPGHPDAATAGQEWRALLVMAAQRFGRTIPGIDDRNTHPGIGSNRRQSYNPDGR